MTESNDPKRSGEGRDPDDAGEHSNDPKVDAANSAEPQSADAPTDESTNNQVSLAGADDASAAGAASENETASASSPPTRRGGRVVAWFALLLALAALVLASMQFLQPDEAPEAPPDDPRIGAFQAEIDALRQRLGEAEQTDPALADLRARVDARLESLESRVRTQESASDQPDPALARLESRIERIAGDINGAVEALRARIAAAEGDIEARLAGFEQGLDGLEGDVRQTAERLSERLRLLRIEALLATGADRLLLFGDEAAAALAWQAALAQAEALDGSRYQQLRGLLAEDLSRLRAVPRPADPAGRASGFLTASGTVSSWPLQVDAAARSGDAEAAAEAPQQPGNWRQRIGGLMDRLVIVERTDDAFLNPAERDRARDRASALLEALALELLRGETTRADVLAAELERHIREIFVVDDPLVSAVLDDLDLSEFDAASPLDPEPALSEIQRLAEALR